MIQRTFLSVLLTLGFSTSTLASLKCEEFIEGLGPINFFAELKKQPGHRILIDVYHETEGTGYLVPRGKSEKQGLRFGQNGGVGIEKVDPNELVMLLSREPESTYTNHGRVDRTFRGLLAGMRIFRNGISAIGPFIRNGESGYAHIEAIKGLTTEIRMPGGSLKIIPTTHLEVKVRTTVNFRDGYGG